MESNEITESFENIGSHETSSIDDNSLLEECEEIMRRKYSSIGNSEEDTRAQIRRKDRERRRNETPEQRERRLKRKRESYRRNRERQKICIEEEESSAPVSVTDAILAKTNGILNVLDKFQGHVLHFDEDIPDEERQFYVKIYPSVNQVWERKVHCTVCNCHIGTAPSQDSIIRMHPVLRVTHCKKCHEFYNSGEFSKGEDGSELYCRWCGQGGEVYCCASCPFVFCKKCIVKNLSRGCVTDIEKNENWNCFVCAPKIMWHLRAQHWALTNFIEKQKQAILSEIHTESEVRRLMSRDLTICCKHKRAVPSTSGHASDSSCDSQSSAKKRKLANGKEWDLENPQRKKVLIMLHGDENKSQVVCTPDVLSFLEESGSKQTQPQQQQQVLQHQQQLKILQAQRAVNIQPVSTPTSGNTSSQAHQPPPLIIRNFNNQQARPTHPVIVPRKPAESRPSSAASKDMPVYHTINGFRIDLNSAAQQETFRLPNGKLIQVKKQGSQPIRTTVSSPNVHIQSTTNLNSANSAPVAFNSQFARMIQRNASTGSSPSPSSSPSPTSGIFVSQGTPNQSTVQRFQLQQQPGPMATIRYATSQGISPGQTIATTVQNTQGQVIGTLLNGQMQQITAAGARPASTPPNPSLVKQYFPPTPLGIVRNQLQNQIFTAMDICQHFTGKIQTLTNSNAYKAVNSCTDVKELYIHLSYLFTFAIGRFKTLQDKCMEDMKKLGFDGDVASLQSGQLEKYSKGNDDDIEIVEPTTTTIDLDSDNDDVDAIPSYHVMKSAVNSSESPTPNSTLSKPNESSSIVEPIENESTTTVPTLNQPAEESLLTPLIPGSATADDQIDVDEIAANLLAGMLEVELYEGADSIKGSTPKPSEPKKPRKKTTNKPNPHLIKQKELQKLEKEKQERLELERLKNCPKLKMPVEVKLKKLDDSDEAMKQMIKNFVASEDRKNANTIVESTAEEKVIKTVEMVNDAKPREKVEESKVDATEERNDKIALTTVTECTKTSNENEIHEEKLTNDGSQKDINNLGKQTDNPNVESMEENKNVEGTDEKVKQKDLTEANAKEDGIVDTEEKDPTKADKKGEKKIVAEKDADSIAQKEPPDEQMEVDDADNLIHQDDEAEDGTQKTSSGPNPDNDGENTRESLNSWKTAASRKAFEENGIVEHNKSSSDSEDSSSSSTSSASTSSSDDDEPIIPKPSFNLDDNSQRSDSARCASNLKVKTILERTDDGSNEKKQS